MKEEGGYKEEEDKGGRRWERKARREDTKERGGNQIGCGTVHPNSFEKTPSGCTGLVTNVLRPRMAACDFPVSSSLCPFF